MTIIPWPPVGRLIPHSECAEHIDALRSALLALAYYDEQDRPCWCSHAAASSGMRHGPPCRDARKAFEDAS